MSVEEKRARSGFVVDGRLGNEAMRARLAEIIDRVRAGPPGRG
jgi:hypothetical protein